jgi:hypothetical protein
MDVWNILSTGVGCIILLAVIHLAVFYVVRMLYPPMPKPVVRFDPVPQVEPVLSEPPIQEKQTVNVPTYDPNIPPAAPSKEGSTDIGSLAGPPV